MTKKVLVLVFVFLLAFQGVALAASGQVVLEDTAYGALIGGILGGAWYLLDQDEADKKIASGVGLGAIAGFFLGITDVQGFVVYEDNKFHFGMPNVTVAQNNGETIYTSGIFSSKF